MSEKQKSQWGDPKWTMRRMIMCSVFAYCGFLILFAFFFPPERITAVSGLVTAVSIIVMPVLLAYLGIAEAGSVIKETRAQPLSKLTSTTTVEEVIPQPQQEGPAPATQPAKRSKSQPQPE